MFGLEEELYAEINKLQKEKKKLEGSILEFRYEIAEVHDLDYEYILKKYDEHFGIVSYKTGFTNDEEIHKMD